MAAETPSAARRRSCRRRSRADSSGGSRRVRAGACLAALDSRSGSCFAADGFGASHAVLCSRSCSRFADGLGGSYTHGGAYHAALCCRFCSCFAHGLGGIYARPACSSWGNAFWTRRRGRLRVSSRCADRVASRNTRCELYGGDCISGHITHTLAAGCRACTVAASASCTRSCCLPPPPLLLCVASIDRYR